jgi:hypothetical protein
VSGVPNRGRTGKRDFSPVAHLAPRSDASQIGKHQSTVSNEILSVPQEKKLDNSRVSFFCLSEEQFLPVETQHPQRQRLLTSYEQARASSMRKPGSILLLCVLLGFGMSLIAPAEDVPETAYDESETLPYVSTSVVSVAAPKVVVPALGERTADVFHFASLREFGSQHRASSSHPVCDSLTIFDRSLRC